MKCFVN